MIPAPPEFSADDPGWRATELASDLHEGGPATVEDALAELPGLEARVTDRLQAQEIAMLRRAIDQELRLRDVLASIRGARPRTAPDIAPGTR